MKGLEGQPQEDFTKYRIPVNANFRNIAQFCVFFTITYTPQNIQYIEIISGIVSYWLNRLTQIKKSNTFSPFFANFVLQTQKKKINGILPPSGVTRSMGLLGSDSKIRFLTSTSSWSSE